jgi:sterol desaturase/sphingolipid hydroxylase (fatty acid hydroxylase superfamily)
MEMLWDILSTTARKVADGSGFWIIFTTYMTMMLTEWAIYLIHDRKAWNMADARANIVNALFREGTMALLTGALFIGVYLFLYNNARLFDVPFLWWGWVLAFILNDLAYYVDHRISHRTGFMWAIHTPHHSSKEMNLLVANRGTVLDLGGLVSVSYFAIPLLGVHPAMFLAVKFFANLWGIFNHTRLVKRMGFLSITAPNPNISTRITGRCSSSGTGCSAHGSVRRKSRLTALSNSSTAIRYGISRRRACSG